VYLKKASLYNFDNRWRNVWSSAMGNLYRSKGNYDSAFSYLNINSAKVSLMRLYNDMKQYDNALRTFNEVVPVITERNNIANLGRIHSQAGKAYSGKKELSLALTFARKADGYFNTINNNLDRIENYELLSDIYQQLGKYDSAYIFLKQYNTLRDSVLNKQFFIRLNDLRKAAEEERKTGQIRLLQKDVLIKEQLLREQLLLKQKTETQLTLLGKDNQINNQLLRLRDQQLLLKDQSLREQQFLRQQKETALDLINKNNKLKDQQLSQEKFIRNALIGGLLLLFAVVLMVFRSIVLRQKNERLNYEKRQAELQQQSSELEMQALRAQMNPHFIFNCLSSINKFILKNESRAASDYLTRFSRLIRRVLTNSQLRMIPLSDEVEMLRLYLDMERLRFDNSFEYHIIFANAIEPETIYVPPMLLQPICENAIWHGLMHMEGHGKLDVVMQIEDDKLHCTITDNGIGRSKAAEINKQSPDKQQSFGLKITNDRIALFNDQKQTESFLRTEDVVDKAGKIAGTKVSLVINYKDAVHELVKQIV
jgi:Histidine kinase/Tetratricopeptide repeat